MHHQQHARADAAGGGTAALRSIYAREIMELFDVVIESSKIGIRKPDPRIYQMIVREARRKARRLRLPRRSRRQS